MRRWRALLPAALGLAVGAACLLRPLDHGTPLPTVLVFWAFALGLVVLPGVALARTARLAPDGDHWLLVGQGATLGLALHGLAFLLGRSLGAPPLLPASLLASAALASLLLARRRAAPEAGPGRAAPLAASLTLAAALGAVLVQPLFSLSSFDAGIPFDLLFHAGNAAEVRHRLPLEDPRVAGIPLRYHFLAYALPIDAADQAGAPLVDTLLGIAPLLSIALLTLQVSNAGRVLFGSGLAGGVGAAIVVFHADPGPLLGLERGAFNSHLAAGLYGSPTTVTGLVLLCGLAIALARWVAAGARTELSATVVLAAATAAAKTTVLPVALAATGLAAARALVVGRRREASRWAVATAAGAAVGVPLTLWQSQGEASYGSLVRLLPADAFLTSELARRLGLPSDGSGPLPVLLFGFALWAVGYLGIGGVGAACWLARRREAFSEGQAWALGVAGVGLAGGFLLAVPGLSQLFLAYNAQLFLALFAGAAIATLASGPRRSALAAAALLAAAAIPVAHHVAQAVPAALRADGAARRREITPAAREYAAGLAWLRSHATRDAVVFAGNPSLVLSALGEVRTFYEDPAYTARGQAAGPGRDPFPERTVVLGGLLRRPDPVSVGAARAAVGAGPRILVVADHVATQMPSGYVVAQPRPVPPRRLLPDRSFTLRFANGVMHVYEAVEEAAAPPLR